MADAVKILTREEILVPRELPKEIVDVPEWGGSVYVKTMTARERDKYQASQLDFSDGKMEVKADNSTAILCSMTICDDKGKRIFTPDDIKELGNQSAHALERISKVARRLSGLTDDEVEKHEKNCEKTTTEDS